MIYLPNRNPKLQKRCAVIRYCRKVCRWNVPCYRYGLPTALTATCATVASTASVSATVRGREQEMTSFCRSSCSQSYDYGSDYGCILCSKIAGSKSVLEASFAHLLNSRSHLLLTHFLSDVGRLARRAGKPTGRCLHGWFRR